LKSDPSELISRHDDPAYQELLADLQQRYQRIRQQYRVHPAIVPQSRLAEPWWAERFSEKLKEARQPGEIDVALIGASLFQEWETTGKRAWEQNFGSLKTLNLGFGGDRTEHLIWRLQHDSFQGTSPKIVLLQAGNNNTAHRMQAPQEVADAIGEIVATLRRQLPNSQIVLLAIFPRGEHPNDAFRKNNEAINQLISQSHDRNEVLYLDLGERFLEPDGTLKPEIMHDYLHLTETGYQRWAEGLKPILQSAKSPPVSNESR
jgi:lysophospholipase L1-like esterase